MDDSEDTSALQMTTMTMLMMIMMTMTRSECSENLDQKRKVLLKDSRLTYGVPGNVPWKHAVRDRR